MTFNRLTIGTHSLRGLVRLKRFFIHRGVSFISAVKKRQGQSTTEYLLVTLLASVFVFALAVRMSPELQETLNRLEDVVALKLTGGKLLGHVKVAERGRFETAAPEAVPTETGRAEGEEGAPPPTAAVSSPRESGDLAFLEGSKSQARRVGAAGGGEAKEMSQEPSPVSPTESAGKKVSPTLTEPQQAAEAAKKKAEEDSKGRGRIYQEGEEGELFEAKGFNWLRLLIILLIIILVAYIGFEIFKGVKSTRIGK